MFRFQAKIISAGLLSILFSSSVFAFPFTTKPKPKKPKSCMIAVNSSFNKLRSTAKDCKNARDNVAPLESAKRNILSGSADDLFSLSLDRIGAKAEDLVKINEQEVEIKAKRDSLLTDLAQEMTQISAYENERCQIFTKDNADYNKAVNSCNRDKRKVVKISCTVPLRYLKRDEKAAKDRCTGVTELATTTAKEKTSTLTQVDAQLSEYRANLEKASGDENKNKIKEAIATLTTQRATFIEQIDAGIVLINAYKTVACNDSTAVTALLTKLVRDCSNS